MYLCWLRCAALKLYQKLDRPVNSLLAEGLCLEWYATNFPFRHPWIRILPSRETKMATDNRFHHSSSAPFEVPSAQKPRICAATVGLSLGDVTQGNTTHRRRFWRCYYPFWDNGMSHISLPRGWTSSASICLAECSSFDVEQGFI